MSATFTPWGRMPIEPVAHTVAVSDPVMMLLRLAAEDRGITVDDALARAVAGYAERVVGLPRLAHLSDILQGRAAVARVAHNHEVACSNHAPATSIHPESEGGQARLARPPAPIGIGHAAEGAKLAATHDRKGRQGAPSGVLPLPGCGPGGRAPP
jgi:hypothetical protein